MADRIEKMVTWKSVGCDRQKTREAAEAAAAGERLVEGDVGLNISGNIFPYTLQCFPRVSEYLNRERHIQYRPDAVTDDDGEQEAKARQRWRGGR